MSFNGNQYEIYADKVITTKGDIVRGNSAGERERYGIGSANQVLQVSSGEPSWQTLSTAGSVLTTQGDVLYHNASGLARLGQSTDGHVLTTKGASADPVWAAVSAGGVWELMQVNDIGGGVAGSTQFGSSAFGVGGFDLDTVSCLKVYISGGNDTTSVDFYAGINNNFTGSRYNYNYFYQDATVMTAVESINQNDFNLLNSNVLDAAAVSFWGEFTIMRDRDLTKYYQLYSQMYTATNGLQIGSCLMANASVGRIISSLEFKLGSGNYEALNAALYKLVNT